MNSGFTQESIESVGDDWAEIRELNEALMRLDQKKRGKVAPEDEDLGLAKAAWKIRVFQQAILYRIVMLGNGCAEAWNSRNILTSILSSRAIMESTVLLWDFEKQLGDFCKKGDFKAINDLCENRTFSTKLKDWYSRTEGNTQAINILTLLDKFDKFCEGSRHHYDSLSEVCHPNSLGHYMAFAKLDLTNGMVTFSELTKFDKAMFSHIIGGFLMIQFVENILDRIDKLLPRVIELSNADQLTKKRSNCIPLTTSAD